MKRMLLLLCLACLAAAIGARADTAIGDWGHFLSYSPKIYLNNPDGKAFSVTVHVMKWPISSWNRATTKVLLTGPDGKVLLSGEHKLDRAESTLDIPAGPKGVYLLETDKNVWISCTLNQSVVWTGEPGKHMIDGRRVVFQASVPRRWWFWVPAGVTEFTCSAQRADRYMSQREDWGFFIISPRGQRIRALWGQPAHTPPSEYRQEQSVRVEVEPGAAGRFWCLEVSLGDSHNYSNINICLEGVPSYLARSPEEWFDPVRGQRPAIDIYDDTPFIQSARKKEMMLKRWPNLQHFSPCPSLGDPDGVEILGDATFALWNPAGRDLGFRIGTYLPRQREEGPGMAHVKIRGANGSTILDKQMPVINIHEEGGQPTDTLKTGKGVSLVDVSGVARWWAFTYPAVPTVLVGKEADRWKRFSFSSCTARNWYFFVPRGTKEFSVRAGAEHETDIVHMEICAPDRTMAIIYANRDQKDIRVPEGLDGKIWYLRPSAGSATRMVTKEGPDHRYQDLLLTVDLRGVPGYLAPTWEQWFDPSNPQPSMNRSTETIP
ncbi:MAG: hypothetical protein HQ559_09495 [Lentisphaerae bacterium]|nr:hypothetical protein [Lentisphaerota bacterium]